MGVLDEFWIVAYLNTDSGSGSAATSNMHLVSGRKYRVEVQGNWDAFGDPTLEGDPQPIMFAGPGDDVSIASFDAVAEGLTAEWTVVYFT